MLAPLGVLPTFSVYVVCSTSTATLKVYLAVARNRLDLLAISRARDNCELALATKSVAHAELLSYMLAINYITDPDLHR